MLDPLFITIECAFVLSETPEIAAKVAARSMTIFKHFYESRGNGCAQQGSEFYSYRGLYKIAFPPTHPLCKDLFVEVKMMIYGLWIDRMMLWLYTKKLWHLHYWPLHHCQKHLFSFPYFGRLLVTWRYPDDHINCLSPPPSHTFTHTHNFCRAGLSQQELE